MSANRKLKALGFGSAESFSLEDDSSFRLAVSWLENHAIGCYPVSERVCLTDVGGAGWDGHYEKYLSDTECPHAATDRPAVLDYLLNLSLRLRYEDNKGEYGKNAESVPVGGVVDLTDAKVCEVIERLADRLEITTKANDPLTTLKAIELVIGRQDHLRRATAQQASGSFHFDLGSIAVGFEPDDPLLKQCAAILRLLYIRDLRQLQSQINEVIAQAQLITADPKTDTKLGNVGF